MTADSLPTLHPEFRDYIQRQPYSVTLDGLRLTVDKDVFPPDMGQCARNLARLSQCYRPTVALDMGCGSGYLALMLKQQGATEVWAADVHPPAVACARGNVARNGSADSVRVVQSDLFAAIPARVKFDLIVFNQPFGPAREQPVCGCGTDGGYEISHRFLGEARTRLRPAGVVLMAFSDREPARHSPDRVARQLGYAVTTVLHGYYSESNNFIFEIRNNNVPASE